MTALHQMHYETDGKTACWACDDCPKRVRVHPDYAIIERGDMTATHRGSIGAHVEPKDDATFGARERSNGKEAVSLEP